MRRLYLHVYLALLGHLVLFLVAAVAASFLLHDEAGERQRLRGVAETLGEVLPAPGAPAAELASTLARLRNRFGFDLTVRDGDGTLIAAVGPALPAPPPGRRRGGIVSIGAGDHRWTAMLRLPDGRWLAAGRARRHDPRWLVAVALFLGILAVVAYPVARRITRRLERLQTRVDRLGSGDLSTRVQVEGRDEVAELARSFNRAAEHIEQLVGAQRGMLAAASHELRSPLARIRMALALLERAPSPALHEQIGRDVAELDELIDELLLASRLQSATPAEPPEAIDVLALAAEEAARVGARITGTPAQVNGDPRLVRRMLRNLLENARRHGRGAPIEARVDATPEGGARIQVSDRGPGVPAAERERIFEAFYRPAGMAEDGRGVGLGLALVRQIARRHGGDAVCGPGPETGTAFTVTLASSARHGTTTPAHRGSHRSV